MIADGVVRGFVHKQDFQYPEFGIIVSHIKGSNRKVPVLLIPDDGTQVVVGREEWERQCGRIEDTMKALEGYDNGDSPHATVAMIRAAILGTNGGQP